MVPDSAQALRLSETQAEPASPPPASSHVAVAAFGPSAERAEGHAATSDRGARLRRMQDAARAEALRALPCLGLLASCVVIGCLLLPPSAPLLAWAGVTTLLWLGWAATPWWPSRRARQQLFAPLGAASLMALALLPWLAEPLAQRWVPEGLLLGLSLAAAGALAPMRAAAVAAALMPLPLALAEALGAAASWSLAAAVLVAGLLLATAGVWLALARHRAWRRNMQAAIMFDERLRAVEAERDKALLADLDKTRFLANASHDLRQPVHAIGLFAATLEKRLRGTVEEPLVRNVMRAIDGLERSFTAMLDISRLDAGIIEPNIQHFPLRDVFRRLHMHFAGDAELAGLCLRFSPGGKFVSSDPQLLERILANLIQNALKYTQQGGVVVVARSTATRINVEVWDTGIGMSAADLPRVFDEFYQVGRNECARAEGLGMGLAIVKRLAQLLGHRLTVSSRPGQGTMFRLGIALGGLADVQDATVPADTLPMDVTEPRTVLVVEDEEPIREALRGLLEEWGCVAIVAASADQALQAIRSQQSTPDLILSDLHLGEGPDGIAVIEAVRRQCGHQVPAILVTGDTSPEELRRATTSGHLVLFKPVQPRKLFNALRGLAS